MHIQVMVLDDGETYSSLAGCKVLWIPDTSGLPEEDQRWEMVEEHVKANYNNPEYSMPIEDIMKSAMIRIEDKRKPV